MFFLTKMYENRFDQNMQKHRMDAKIAPRKSYPNKYSFYDTL